MAVLSMIRGLLGGHGGTGRSKTENVVAAGSGSRMEHGEAAEFAHAMTAPAVLTVCGHAALPSCHVATCPVLASRLPLPVPPFFIRDPSTAAGQKPHLHSYPYA